MSPFLIIIILQIFFFAFAALFKTDKLTDLSYGLTFIIVSWVLFFDNPYTVTMILMIMVIFWGVRLSSYLFTRINILGKDERFDGIREKFWPFARFWALQALSIYIIMLPTIIIMKKNIPFNLISIVGIIIWMKGFTIESIADNQKFLFKLRNPKGFMKTGLFKYSQFPNYYGEMLVWFGIFVYCLPYLSGIEYLTVLSPIFISVLLLFVTGIPPLKKRYLEKYGKEYKEYEKKTSLLIPWFSKGTKADSRKD